MHLHVTAVNAGDERGSASFKTQTHYTLSLVRTVCRRLLSMVGRPWKRTRIMMKSHSRSVTDWSYNASIVFSSLVAFLVFSDLKWYTEWCEKVTVYR